jgi:uncharacterized phage-associated protein
MESPLAVANYFIQKSFETGVVLTPMKLVKLVYIAHGWYLGLTGEPLLSEQVQAWQYGPVVKSVYDEFKAYGSQPITSYGYAPRGDGEYGLYVPIVSDGKIKKFLDKVWDVYKGYTAIQLSSLTHQQNTPWDQVYNKMGGKYNKFAVIRDDIIKDHYKTKIKPTEKI